LRQVKKKQETDEAASAEPGRDDTRQGSPREHQKGLANVAVKRPKSSGPQEKDRKMERQSNSSKPQGICFRCWGMERSRKGEGNAERGA